MPPEGPPRASDAASSVDGDDTTTAGRSEASAGRETAASSTSDHDGEDDSDPADGGAAAEGRAAARANANDTSSASAEAAKEDPVDLSKAPKLGRRPVLIFAGAALGLYALFGPKLPREQRIRVPLGSARATAREARIAWWSTGGEPLREASFSFAPGEAPEALIHELRLPDGDYDVDVEIVLMEGRTASRKRVTVSGATTTLDVSFRP